MSSPKYIFSLLHIIRRLCYNKHSQGFDQDSTGSRKSGPPGSSHSPAVLLCLLALAVPLKPLAHVVANYARYERHKEIDQDFQQVHPLSVASLGKGSGDILTKFDQKCKGGKVKPTPFLPIAIVKNINNNRKQGTNASSRVEKHKRVPSG